MIKNVRIIGLGLMGANLAINLISKGVKVYGDDTNHLAIKRAQDLGIDVYKSDNKVDITILAMPVNKIISYLKENKEINNTEVLLDIGGTKQEICDLMDNIDIPAIGGHPMCGLADNNSWEPSPEIYENATFLLCETKSTSQDSKKIVSDFLDLLKAEEVWIDRERHDEIISITSHIPHLISSALVGIAKDDYQINEIMGMAAGGFDGATRLTRTNPEMIIDMY
ncbi:MAG: prephenate dehydrogenase, partial [Actinomycetota bacterium]|nr:prephenate dehydrogenase [Actinomycetota bacterium]